MTRGISALRSPFLEKCQIIALFEVSDRGMRSALHREPYQRTCGSRCRSDNFSLGVDRG